MSKVEGGVRLTPPPSRLRVTIFSRRLLGLKMEIFHLIDKEHAKMLKIDGDLSGFGVRSRVDDDNI